MKFKIGDRVIHNHKFCSNDGATGVIIHIEDSKL